MTLTLTMILPLTVIPTLTLARGLVAYLSLPLGNIYPGSLHITLAATAVPAPAL